MVFGFVFAGGDLRGRYHKVVGEKRGFGGSDICLFTQFSAFYTGIQILLAFGVERVPKAYRCLAVSSWCLDGVQVEAPPGHRDRSVSSCCPPLRVNPPLLTGIGAGKIGYRTPATGASRSNSEQVGTGAVTGGCSSGDECG